MVHGPWHLPPITPAPEDLRCGVKNYLEQLKVRSAQTTVLVEEGDLTRLLPKLRMGELDLFVGRLEPGYASPDLETEALYDEPMVAVVRPGHALLAQPASWQALADMPCVMPPPWASLSV